MKHQLDLRRLLLYVALFAVGMGMLRVGVSSNNVVAVMALILAFYGVVAGLLCPIGYLVFGKDGELLVALVILVIEFCLVMLLR